MGDGRLRMQAERARDREGARDRQRHLTQPEASERAQHRKTERIRDRILFRNGAPRGLRLQCGVHMETVAGAATAGQESSLRRRMYWLLGLTFVHVLGEGGIALVEAIRTGSLALLAFGLESVIEGGAAFLAVRHLHHLADEEEDHARREQMLARWIGWSFLLLATYTLGRGAFEILGGHAHQEKSLLGLLLTIFASFGMPLIGYFKLKTGRQLGSKGLAAEAKESIACSFDSWLTLLAMLGGLLSAPGWLDPALSLLMVPWFLREGLIHARGRVHAHEH
jgi:divalent metal cation (Fe/Co/Zn/Cd) transporter